MKKIKEGALGALGAIMAAALMVFFYWVGCGIAWKFYFEPRVEKMLAPAEADTIQAVYQPRSNYIIEVTP